MSDYNRTISVGFHKIHPGAFDPIYATEGSACFDIKACFVNGKCLIKSFTDESKGNMLLAASDLNSDTKYVTLPPHSRTMIPTQLAFDIPDGWSMRLHMRSGLSIHGGLMLCNAEGIIDSDYTDELMVLVYNSSKIPIRINHGDRICQGEIVPTYRANFYSCQKPQPKTSRNGGFGSTGKS